MDLLFWIFLYSFGNFIAALKYLKLVQFATLYYLTCPNLTSNLALETDGSTSSHTLHLDVTKVDKEKSPGHVEVSRTKSSDRRVSNVSVHKAVPTSSGLANGGVIRSTSFDDS